MVKEANLPPTSEPLKKALAFLKLTNKDDLYIQLSKDTGVREQLLKELKKKNENRFMKYWTLQFLWSDKDNEGKKIKRNEELGITDTNTDIVIAPCCSPIPGDDVVGMNIGGKVTVHKRKCPEAIRLMSSYGDKIVPVKWVTQKVMSFQAILKLSGIDRVGMVSDITTVISKESGVNMRVVHFETKDGVFEGMIHVYVHNTQDLNRLISKISALKGVEKVVRVENIES